MMAGEYMDWDKRVLRNLLERQGSYAAVIVVNRQQSHGAANCKCLSQIRLRVEVVNCRVEDLMPILGL